MSEVKKKLTVRRETLRDLSATELNHAVGGVAVGVVIRPGNIGLAGVLRISAGGDCGMGIQR